MKKFCLCFLVAFIFCIGASFSSAAELKDIDQAGLEKLLRENRGKVVLLNFFATWCPPCRVEIPELVSTRKDYSKDNLVIIGLSVDEEAAPVLPFISKHGVNYPVYKADKSITDHFQVSSVPHNAFFAKEGKMVISEPGMADSAILKSVIDKLMAEK